MKLRISLSAVSLLFALSLTAAQDQGQSMPGMKMPPASPSPTASPMPKKMAMPSASPNQMPSDMSESDSENSQLVMSGEDMGVRIGKSENVMFIGQMGSGTSWQPISSRMYMMDKVKGKWLLMFHYNLVLGMNSQRGPRGVTKFESANWFMPIAFRRVGRGTLQVRAMLSAEPFTFPPGGSPLLFQTGETYKGKPLVDHQHPHDLIMELSAQYTLPLGERSTWFTYFGYPGEPALGPVAFMHRLSASEDPSAPLSHHLQDSTHISYGVFTTGFTYRWLKLEGSIFNGQEPDENRYNFEAHPWLSRSFRFSVAPNNNWAIQVSHGFLRNPETLEPGTTRRTTASISYNHAFHGGFWATSLIWGRNHENHGVELFNLNGYLAESTVNFLNKNYFYARLELVDKNALLDDSDRAQLGITQEHPSFRIGAYTFGGVRDVWTAKKFSVGVGGDFTFYTKPSTLDPIYGEHPTAFRFFVRIRPAKMDMSGHGGHSMMNKMGDNVPAKP